MADRSIFWALAASVLAHAAAFGLWTDAGPAQADPPQLLEARLVVPEPVPPAPEHPRMVRPPANAHAAARPHAATSSEPHARIPEPVTKPAQSPSEAPSRLTSDAPREVPVAALSSGSGPASAAAPVTNAPVAPVTGTGPAPAYVPPSFGASYLHNPKPAYPLMARRRGLQGLVRLDVKVNAEGIPIAVKVKDSSGHESLDEAALTAVWHWRFAPARRGGDAVEGSVVVPVRFNLDGESAG